MILFPPKETYPGPKAQPDFLVVVGFLDELSLRWTNDRIT